MQIGILFPQTEFGTDPVALREYARAIVEYGFKHVTSYEHVLGAVDERLPENYAPFSIDDAFHEPLLLYAFMAAAAPELGFATSILVLPQRQTALVAKQAADLYLKSGGKFRLGVGIGWNAAEFEGMGRSFRGRASLMEEQIKVLRLLWTEKVVNFTGSHHQLQGLGLEPRPPVPVPIWLGAKAEPAVRRAAIMGDGFFPLQPLEGGWQATFDRMRAWREEAGLSWEGYGIEARVDGESGWREQAESWQQLGATHVYINTMGKGLSGPADHLEFLKKLAAEL